MGMQEWAVCGAKWLQFVIGLAILLGSFMHLNDQLSGQDWCDANKDLKCIGDSLTWAKEGNRVEDNNFTWRQTFTFAPSYFIDTWTPFFFGFLVLSQHFPSLQVKSLVCSWGRCLGLYLFGCFWAIFGYAGNWGVFWGFICTLCLCPVLLYLAVVDGTPEQTQVDFTKYLAMIGLTHSGGDENMNSSLDEQPGQNKGAPDQSYNPSYNEQPNQGYAMDPEQNNTYTAPPATGSRVTDVQPPQVPVRPPSYNPDMAVQVEPEAEKRF